MTIEQAAQSGQANFGLEDLLGQVEQVNLPGTVAEHPNWRRKLAKPIEEWTVDNNLHRLFHAVNRARLKATGNRQV